MYSVEVSDAQVQIGYLDVFTGEVPDLEAEIKNLNIHKTVSIICELIQVKDSLLDPIKTLGGEFRIPLETILKREMCGITANTPEEMFSNPLFRKDLHIISLQMLLILLKKVIQYGNFESINDAEYEITKDDYEKVIQLQLVVADEINRKHMIEVDTDHFLYSTYHLNFKRNMAHEFLRMYYMLEKISRDIHNFDEDVQKEYRDYYSDFTTKYGFTPTQYSSYLFWELTTYYTDKNGLSYHTMWKSVNKEYDKFSNKDMIREVIGILSRPLIKHRDWAIESDAHEWDFSKFYEYPFIMDSRGNYISISDVTLVNAFFEKIFWLIRGCYSETDSRSMAFFGRLFEKYIQDVTQEATKGEYTYIKEFSYRKRKEKKSSDAYIRKGTDLLVVEAKGFSVLLDCITKNENVEKNNHKLFVDPILQADVSLEAVIEEKEDFAGVEEAYIVSVTMDNINAVPNYYNAIHNRINKEKKCSKTKYYFNFSIEEYEMLLYLIEQQYNIFSLLKDYSENEKLKPFSNYLHEKYADIKMTTFMEKIYHEASEEMKGMLFDE